MINLCIIIAILAMIGGAAAYIVREKKKGARCIGCTAAGKCAAKCGKYVP